ncbi:PH domain-containing protein [Streptomyces collinus]
MTTPDHQSPAPRPPASTAASLVYRSPLGLVAGVLLLALIGWLGIDALIAGHGRTPWFALAGLILLVPLVTAFTLRPAVFSGEDRLRVRNPFRSVSLPWGEIASVRSGYTNEVVTDSGAKYQLWAVPVSMRDRKKAARRQSGAGRPGRSGGFGMFGGAGAAAADHDGPARAESDRIVADLRTTLDRRGTAEAAQGEVSARWAYEVIAPAIAGAVLLLILLATG